MNVMHSSMKITDEFYSNLNDGEVRNRIGALSKENQANQEDQTIIDLLRKFLAWKQKH